jgi:sensor histidine kinase regulating citrate/malate metabolism
VEELVGSRHMINALRATTHEFLNKLQVISGLLQMGQVSQAQSYIGDVASNHEHIIGPVMRLIRNANVAALILGKERNMKELDVRLNLLRNSQLPEQSRYLETEELVTLVGNLLENAMEAVNAAPADGMRTVDLQITEDEKGLLVMVSDTGEGIRSEDLPHIFENGFSTKAKTGRGIGMKLIRDIADRRGGSIDVDTEPGSGTTISVIFGRERGEQP